MSFNKVVKPYLKRIKLIGFIYRILYFLYFYLHLRKNTFIAKRVIKKYAEHKKTNNLVVFVSDFPRVREAKLAYGLKLCGWNVVLLYKKFPIFDPSNYFDESLSYKDPAEAIIKAAPFNPEVYHVFSGWNHDTQELFLSLRPGKIIIDIYDNLAGMLKEASLVNLKQQIEKERYCLENADGVCCRNLETQYAKKSLGYKMKGLKIFFPEYCWGNHSHFPKLSETDNTLHVVYGGSIWVEKIYGEDIENGFLWLARLLAKHGIHFHLYPGQGEVGPDFNDKFSEYINLQETTTFFHLHMPVPPKQWIKEISQYDAGVYIFRSLLVGVEPKQYTTTQAKLSYSNLVPDFVDADVHLLANDGLFVTHLCKRLGVCTTVTMECLDNRKFWDSTFQKIKGNMHRFVKARKEWSIEKNCHRLVEFYERICSDKYSNYGQNILKRSIVKSNDKYGNKG